MKRTIIIFLIILLTLTLGLSSLYLYTDNNVKNNYLNNYNICLRINQERPHTDYPQEIGENCLNEGGCYNRCASACAPSKPSISFFEMFSSFAKSSESCPDVCVSQCFYPLDKFN